MRKDEEGNECPETLGEYRDLVAIMVPKGNNALLFLDKKIAETPNGRAEKVIASDLQMRAVLFQLIMVQLPEEPIGECTHEAPEVVSAACSQNKSAADFSMYFAHAEACCFQCGGALWDLSPTRNAPGSGHYRGHCKVCNILTWYDCAEGTVELCDYNERHGRRERA